MKILITGIHGFVGSNLVKALSSSNIIYGLDIVTPNVSGVKKTFLWEDVDRNVLPEVDAIIHLAGKAHDLKKESVSDLYFQVNTGLTKKIYDWFLNSTTKKFIFFSSVKAAADYVPGDILTEDIIPNPVGPYGESKIAAERYILETASKRQKFCSDELIAFDDARLNIEGKQTYILRPCMIHGPGNKGNLNLLYGVVSKGIPWPLGAFENRRSFTSIGNLIFVIQELLSKDIISGIYNIGDDEALSTNELIHVVCSALGNKARIWRLPKGLMLGVAKLGDFIHFPLNSERMKKLTENYVVSNAKIKKALGVDRFPVRAVDGLAATIKSFY